MQREYLFNAKGQWRKEIQAFKPRGHFARNFTQRAQEIRVSSFSGKKYLINYNRGDAEALRIKLCDSPPLR